MPAENYRTGCRAGKRWIPDGLTAVLLGTVAFFWITGGTILDPGYIAWLMHGDAATHWLGWHFFRDSPLLQWPLGANPRYGMDISSSLVFSDSLPLLALIFKPFSPLLGEYFQYMGLWVLACLVLQSWFAWRLLSLFLANRGLALLGSVFFTLAPIYMMRLSGHLALMGHWLLLAGFVLYFADRFSGPRWSVLLALAALVHAYLLVLVLAIFCADLAQRRWSGELARRHAGEYLVLGLLSTLAVMWAAGYFMLGSSVGGGSFGYYRMNLLAPLDSSGSWSRLLRDVEGGPGDYEGFNYLGLGMIVLTLMACQELLRGTPIGKPARVVPISLLALGLLIFALSNKVAVGPIELVSYPLPGLLEKGVAVFRVSGRFFWPVFYLIYLMAFFLVFRRVTGRKALVLCAALLAVQVYDIQRGLGAFRPAFANPPVLPISMRDSVWEGFARHYDSLRVVPPGNHQEDWLPLAFYAGTHEMTVNMGYFARLDGGQLHEAREALRAAIQRGDWRADSLYVFQEDDLWEAAMEQRGPGDLVRELDGFRVLAPGWLDCVECDAGPAEGPAEGPARVGRGVESTEGPAREAAGQCFVKASAGAPGARFSGSAWNEDGHPVGQAAVGDRVDASVVIVPDPRHAGRTGALYLVVEMADGRRLAKRADGGFVLVRQGEAIPPVHEGRRLERREALDVARGLRMGKALAGNVFRVHAGYALDGDPCAIYYAIDLITLSVVHGHPGRRQDK